jgi:signal transduction histidine kinase
MMPDAAEQQDWGAQPPGSNRIATLEIPPDMIEVHVARARQLRAQAFARLFRRWWKALRWRRAADPATTAVARRRADIDRLGETLRQPLTSIRALSELLQENPGLPAEQHAHMLGLIVEETKRLNRLIGQCLDLVAEAGIANDRYSERDRRGAA